MVTCKSSISSASCMQSAAFTAPQQSSAIKSANSTFHYLDRSPAEHQLIRGDPTWLPPQHFSSRYFLLQRLQSLGSHASVHRTRFLHKSAEAVRYEDFPWGLSQQDEQDLLRVPLVYMGLLAPIACARPQIDSPVTLLLPKPGPGQPVSNRPASADLRISNIGSSN